MNELINNGKLTEKALTIIKQAKEADLMIQKAKANMSLLNDAILEAMEESGTKKFECDDAVFTYVAPTSRKTVDTKALKDQGLYDLFVKETPVKASLRVKYKHE